MIVRRGVGRAAGVGLAPGFNVPSATSSSISPSISPSPSPSVSPSASASRSVSPSASRSPSSSVSPSPSPSDGGFAISSVTGTINHGASVTIAGSGFGTKSAAAPTIWDNCDGTNIDTLWSTVYPSTAGGLFDMQYITPTSLGQGVALPFSRGTKYMAGCHRNINTATGGNFVGVGFNYTKDFTKPTYLNYWMRVDPAWVDSGEDQNFKLWSVNNDPTAGHFGEYQYLEVQNSTFTGAGSGNIVLHMSNAAGFGYNGATFDDDAPNPATGWHQWEHLVTWGGSGAGRLIIVVDGVQRFDSGVCVTDSATGTDRAELIGNYARSRGTENYRYFKHLYVDRSYARVILGNASTLAACTIREPQIASAWADGSITVTANLGALTNGSTAYVYVITSTNTATAGFAVTLGS